MAWIDIDHIYDILRHDGYHQIRQHECGLGMLSFIEMMLQQLMQHWLYWYSQQSNLTVSAYPSIKHVGCRRRN
jgi:hypothetical protein